jgi:acetyl-CoA C-acetyltransferase
LVKGKVAVVGYGRTKITKIPRDPLELAIEATRKALDSANLTLDDIDVVIVSRCFIPPPEFPDFPVHMAWGLLPCKIGMIPCEKSKLKMNIQILSGGSTCHTMIMTAMGLIESGAAETVLIAGAETWGSAPIEQAVKAMTSMGIDPDFETPYGWFQVAAMGALMTQRYMYETGTTIDQIAAVCVSNRKWASLNPDALYQKWPFTIDDVLNSPVVCSPLHLYMINPLGNGGVALILTSAEKARKLVEVPVTIIGYGSKFVRYGLSEAPIVSEWSGMREAIQEAYKMAAIEPKDIDVAEIYEAYPFTTLMMLELMGVVPRGQAGKFVMDGQTMPGGKLPTSTNGGCLSDGHIGSLVGLLFHIEAVCQLRGEAGKRQVPGAEIALVNAGSGTGGDSHVMIYKRER